MMAGGRTALASALHIGVFGAMVVMAGCNRYDNFRLAGFQQESFSNKADVLFITDNSASMQEEATSLAINFEAFITELADAKGTGQADGLSDAVGAYIQYVQARTEFVNYNLGVTSTDVVATYGALEGERPVIAKGDEAIAKGFLQNLVCDTACITQEAIGNDPQYLCGEPMGDSVTKQWLECECETQTISENCAATGQEEPIEALYMAMCRSVENPPPDCFDPVNQFTQADVMSNAPFLREGSTVIPVFVTDEGDQSRRIINTSGLDIIPEVYFDLFAQFSKNIRPVVIGPVYDFETESFPCPTGAAKEGTLRLEAMVRHYNGIYTGITDENCEVRDFAEALDELGTLLKSLLDTFPLQAIPDVDTIIVVVDGVAIGRSESSVDELGLEVFTDGWSYRPADNAVVLHGAALPDYEAEIRVYYQPLEGLPRELPF